MNTLSITILTSGLSTLMFVPQILAQTSNPVNLQGDRNLASIGIETLDSATSHTFSVAAKLVLAIQRIETNTTSRQTLTEGDELLVTVYGTPRASASFRLEGLNRNRAVTMSEVERGVYEGRYIIRRHDRQVNSRLTATLTKQGARTVTREFNQAIAINSTGNDNNNNPPVASNLVIERIETNTTSRQTLTQGDELLVTAYGTPRASASFRLEGLNRNRSVTMTEVERGIYEGRYMIRRNDGQVNSNLIVTLTKQGANTVTREFNQAIAINSTGNDNNNSNNNSNNNGNNNNSQTLKPEITNFNNNDVIRLPLDLVGQTLPNANVQVTIEALRSVIGIVDISQTLFNTTVSADGQGKFTVNLPSGNLVAGTRYRVRLTATKNNQSQSNEIFLRQN